MHDAGILTRHLRPVTKNRVLKGAKTGKAKKRNGILDRSSGKRIKGNRVKADWDPPSLPLFLFPQFPLFCSIGIPDKRYGR